MIELECHHFKSADENKWLKQESSKAFNHTVEDVGEQVWSMEAKYLHPQDLPITKEKPFNLKILQSQFPQ